MYSMRQFAPEATNSVNSGYFVELRWRKNSFKRWENKVTSLLVMIVISVVDAGENWEYGSNSHCDAQ